ncbi:MAG TPA: YdcF family protein [Thermoanaerobaculia bacterium]|nr:YdcF family protein [Thermoanaerobaculia bacterium]
MIIVLPSVKSLAEPLLPLLLLAGISLLIALRRSERARRRPLFAALAAVVLIWIVSTQACARLIGYTLELPPEPEVASPEVIAVPSGGASRSADPALDVLSTSTGARVAAAVVWWHANPSARLIMTGADRLPGRTSARTLEIMRDEAILRGVPRARIEVETRSLTTREHPLGLLFLPGITPATRVGLVTSAWHMRRALREFRRYFTTVIPHGVPPAETTPLTIGDFLPSADGLRGSTMRIEEWIGIGWYSVRARWA